MSNQPKTQKHRCFHLAILLAAIIGSFAVVAFILNNQQPAVAYAQAKDTPVVANEFYTEEIITVNGNSQLEKISIHGSPHRPPRSQILANGGVIDKAPDPIEIQSANTLTVPAYTWVLGCSSVSAAMIAGYYDRNGYPNIYSGPTAGGVMPLDDGSWPAWSDVVSDVYPNNPLVASHQGVDGRAGRGTIDDYWVSYMGGAQDLYITNSWAEHTWGGAIGDFMKTSQYAYGNDDGSTTFYFNATATPLTCAAMEGYGVQSEDGTYGRKLFYEARGYTVTDCYAQKTDNIVSGGFSFAQYKAEINAGRPVLINLAGHTIVGVGYNDTGNTVYLHDTWDLSTYSMTWGGSYAGMAMQNVSIVNLQSTGAATPTYTPTRTPTITQTPSRTPKPSRTPTSTRTSTATRTPTKTSTPSRTPTITPTPLLAPTLISPTNGQTGVAWLASFDWSDVSGATGYSIQVSKNSTFTQLFGTYKPTGSVYKMTKNLSANTTYWWRVQATDPNSPSAYSVIWSFTTGP